MKKKAKKKAAKKLTVKDLTPRRGGAAIKGGVAIHEKDHKHSGEIDILS